MATWVRSGTGTSPSAVKGDLTGTVALDNSTAPGDFDPSFVDSVEIAWRLTIANCVNDTWVDHRSAALIVNGAEAATVDNGDANRTADGSYDEDLTDSSPSTSGTVAQWEAAYLQETSADGVWVTYDKYHGGDSGDTATIPVANVTVTITYTPNYDLSGDVAVSAATGSAVTGEHAGESDVTVSAVTGSTVTGGRDVTADIPEVSAATGTAVTGTAYESGTWPFTDDFTGSDDDPLDTNKWTVDNGGHGPTPTIQSNQGYFAATTAGAGGRGYAIPPADEADDELLVKFNLAASDGWLEFFLRATGAFSDDVPQYGYGVAITTDSVELYYCDDYSENTVATDTPTISDSTDYWLRFRVGSGDVQQIRVWADGSSEPGTWNIDQNDTNEQSAGGLGIGTWANSSVGVLGYIDDLDLHLLSEDYSGAVSVSATSGDSVTGEKGGEGDPSVSATTGSAVTGGRDVTADIPEVSAATGVTVTGIKDATDDIDPGSAATGVTVDGEKWATDDIDPGSAATGTTVTGEKNGIEDVTVSAVSAVAVTGEKWDTDDVTVPSAASAAAVTGEKWATDDVAVSATSATAVTGSATEAHSGDVSVSSASNSTVSGAKWSTDDVDPGSAATGSVVTGEKGGVEDVAVSTVTDSQVVGGRDVTGDPAVSATGALAVTGTSGEGHVGDVSVSAVSGTAVTGEKWGTEDVSVAATTGITEGGLKAAQGDPSVSSNGTIGVSGAPERVSDVTLVSVTGVDVQGRKSALNGSPAISAVTGVSVTGVASQVSSEDLEGNPAVAVAAGVTIVGVKNAVADVEADAYPAYHIMYHLGGRMDDVTVPSLATGVQVDGYKLISDVPEITASAGVVIAGARFEAGSPIIGVDVTGGSARTTDIDESLVTYPAVTGGSDRTGTISLTLQSGASMHGRNRLHKPVGSFDPLSARMNLGLRSRSRG